MHYRNFTAAIAVVALASTCVAQGVAEKPATGRNTTDSRTAGTQAVESNQLDQVIAACFVLGNNEEVALGEFAQGKAQHKEVKAFAAMMIKDHKAAAQMLQKYVPANSDLKLSAEANQGANARGENRDQPGATRSSVTQNGAKGSNDSSPYAQMIALNKSAHEACLRLTTEELASKEGPEFDMCYVGSQIGAHMGMLAKIEAAEMHATGELKTVASQMKTKVEAHLAHAKELAKTLQSEQQSSTNRSST